MPRYQEPPADAPLPFPLDLPEQPLVTDSESQNAQKPAKFEQDETQMIIISNKPNKRKNVHENALKNDCTRQPPLEQRREAFRQTLLDFKNNNPDKYPDALYEDFFNYWSEANDRGTLMLFEARKRQNHGIFSLAGRLATWASHDKKFQARNNFNQNKNDQKLQDIFNRLDARAP